MKVSILPTMPLYLFGFARFPVLGCVVVGTFVKKPVSPRLFPGIGTAWPADASVFYSRFGYSDYLQTVSYSLVATVVLVYSLLKAKNHKYFALRFLFPILCHRKTGAGF